jgi:hypothetical protein
MHTVVNLPDGLDVRSAFLFPWPEDPASWLRAQLGDGVEIVASEDATTDLGWPLTLFHLEIDGEAHVLALYKFLELAGAVQVRGVRGEAAITAVLAALRAARPDFSTDEAICLADLCPPEDSA